MATSARIDELRKKFDENPRRYFAPLANEYRKAGDLEQAVFICEEYLPQQPGHMSGHIVYGQALFELGRYDAARGVFETALSLDPENLIALRHLGDIARLAGDTHTARAWYRRVLEADPRNEDVAQVMLSLPATPAESAVVDDSAATPLTNAVVSQAPAEPPTSAPTPEAQPVDVSPATPPAESPRVTSPSPTPIPPPPVSPPSFMSRHAPADDELLDLDSFDLGGVPLGSLRNGETAETRAEPQPSTTSSSEILEFEAVSPEMNGEDEEFVEKSYDTFEPGAPVSSASSTVDAAADGVEIEKARELTAADFEQDPYAIGANPLTDGEAKSFTEDPPGTVEPAPDLVLGLPQDSDRSSTLETSDASLNGFETFESGVLAGSSSTPSNAESSLTTESFFDVPVSAGAESSVDEALAKPAAAEASSVGGETTGDELLKGSESEPYVEASKTMAHEAPEPIATPRFHEAQPASLQGDPLMTPAFGAVEPIAEAAIAPEAETEFAHDSRAIGDVDAIASSDSAEAGAHVPAGAFVTETMATLYLAQGHFDAALDIYRQLVQQRPDDIALRDRLHAAEERAWGHHQGLGAAILDADVAPPFDDVTPAPRSYGGPTIRDFLTGILFPQPAEQQPAPPDETSATQPGATPSSGDSLAASLGALFSEADAAAPAERQADSTFAGPVAAPTTGTPAHRASNELSLDHVFKANTAQGGRDQAFSFDQFFSDEAAEQRPSPSPEPPNETTADSSDDIAQFNAWLSGLKKS